MVISAVVAEWISGQSLVIFLVTIFDVGVVAEWISGQSPVIFVVSILDVGV